MTYGWTFAEIDDMHFGAIHDALTQGKPQKGLPVRSEEDVQAYQRQFLRWLRGGGG